MRQGCGGEAGASAGYEFVRRIGRENGASYLGAMTTPCIAKRNEIERLFRCSKGYHRIFSRFEKLDVLFLGFLKFAFIAEALR